MESPVLIHHLTDLHVGPLHWRPSGLAILDKTKVESEARHVERYLKHLESLERRPDLVVLSGDLTSYASEAEFRKMSEILDKLTALLEETGSPSARGSRSKSKAKSNPRICVVPGNHDMDWTRLKQEEKTERFRLLCHHRSGVFTPFSKQPFVHYEDHNLLVWAFDSCPLGGVNDPQILDLKVRFSDVMKKMESIRSGAAYSRWKKLLDELERLGRQDPGYILPEDLELLDGSIDERHNSVFKLAVMHHNPAMVPAPDVDRYQSILNGGEIKDRLMRKGFDLILHGHRHFPHCSYEEYLDDQGNREQRGSRYANGIYTLGGPSLGSPSFDARWFSIQIEAATHVYEEFPPASLVTVRSAIERGGKFVMKDAPTFRMPIGKKIHADFQALQQWLGRTPTQDESVARLRASVDTIQLSLLRLQAEVDDWNEGNSWQSVFHDDLKKYFFVYGIDRLGPASWFNPTYLQYQAQQFGERKARRDRNQVSTSELAFSPGVMRAIDATGWKPPKGVDVVQRNDDSPELEIARVLIWREEWLKERSILQMIDSYHRLFGVPVFLIQPEMLERDGNEEYVLALSDQAVPIRCYTYDLEKGGDTREVKAVQRARYLRDFRALLTNRKLTSIGKFLAQRRSS